MKSKSAKSKGRRCSAEVRSHLLDYAPDLGDRDITVTSSGETGADLKLSEAAFRHYPFEIECKNVEKLNIWKALEQAESHKGDGISVLFFRRNRSKLYISMEIEDFLRLWKKEK